MDVNAQPTSQPQPQNPAPPAAAGPTRPVWCGSRGSLVCRYLTSRGCCWAVLITIGYGSYVGAAIAACRSPICSASHRGVPRGVRVAARAGHAFVARRYGSVSRITWKLLAASLRWIGKTSPRSRPRSAGRTGRVHSCSRVGGLRCPSRARTVLGDLAFQFAPAIDRRGIHGLPGLRWDAGGRWGGVWLRPGARTSGRRRRLSVGDRTRHAWGLSILLFIPADISRT